MLICFILLFLWITDCSILDNLFVLGFLTLDCFPNLFWIIFHGTRFSFHFSKSFLLCFPVQLWAGRTAQLIRPSLEARGRPKGTTSVVLWRNNFISWVNAWNCVLQVPSVHQEIKCRKILFNFLLRHSFFLSFWFFISLYLTFGSFFLFTCR